MKLPRVMVALTLVLVLAMLGFVPVVQGVLQAGLDGGGTAYEINRDSLGNLYVSDADSQKIWKINPDNGSYVTYSFGRTVRDAQIDNYNRIWWADGGDTFGYVNPDTHQVTRWTLTSSPPYTIQALFRDNLGGVWLGESDGWRLFHFNPSSLKLCSFTLGDFGVFTHDMIYQAGYLWVGQWNSGGVYRVSPGDDTLTYKYWDKGYSAGPWGLYLDGGNLWWADYYLSAIVRLDTNQDLATFYYLPVGFNPKMMTIYKGNVWYTEVAYGQVGTFNPSTADFQEETLPALNSDPIMGDCTTLSQGSTSTAQYNSGSLSWSESYTNIIYNQGGWKIFDLGGGIIPYGIASYANRVWANAQGQGQSLLLRFEAQTSIFLPIIRQN